MYNVRPDDRPPTVQQRKRLQLNAIRRCLQKIIMVGSFRKNMTEFLAR